MIIYENPELRQARAEARERNRAAAAEAAREQQDANIDYIAMMAEIELPENEEDDADETEGDALTPPAAE